MRGRDRKDPFRARNIISPQTLPVKNEPRVFPIFYGFCAIQLSQTHRSVRQSVKSAGQSPKSAEQSLKSAMQSLKSAEQSESEMPCSPAFVSLDPPLCAAAGDLMALSLRPAIADGISTVGNQTSAAPSVLQASTASSSGASLQMTKSQAITAPSSTQRSFQLRIHSPSPQP